MIAYGIGVLNAFVLSFSNSQVRSLKDVDQRLLNCIRFGQAAIIIAAIITVLGAWSMPASHFWPYYIFITVLNALAAYCSVKAYQSGEQSLVGPLNSLSSIFLIPLALVVLGEKPSLLGVVGIVSVVVGVFIQSWGKGQANFGANMKALLKEKGSLYMVGFAIFGSVAIVLTKFAYHYTTPMIAGFFDSLGIFALNAVFLRNVSLQPLRGKEGRLALLGSSFGLAQLCHYIGISLIFTSYYISIKRLSLVFDVLFGWKAGDKDIPKRLFAALVMVVGVVFIALG